MPTYEIGISYPGNETDQQVKINLSKISINIDRLQFYYNSIKIPHWIEDRDNRIVWVKVPVLNGTTKIYLDDSASKDLSNIDETMIFGDDFRNETSLDTSKWDYTTYCLEQLGSYSPTGDNIDLIINNNANFSGKGTIDTTTVNGATVGWLGHSIRSKQTFENIVIETYLYHNDLYSTLNSDYDGTTLGLELTDSTGSNRINFFNTHNNNGNNLYYELSLNNATLNAGNATATYYTNQFVTGYHTMKIVKTPTNITIQADNYASSTYSVDLTNLYLVIFDTVRNVNDEANDTFYYVFVHKYLSTEPKILYIKPYSKQFFNKITIFNQSNNILSYKTNSYIETPVIELISNSHSQINSSIKKIYYYRGSNTQPDITESGTTIDIDNNIHKYWNQNTIINSGWNNITPSSYITYSSDTILNYKYVQFKIPLEYNE